MWRDAERLWLFPTKFLTELPSFWGVSCVETDDREEASSSPPPKLLRKVVDVELLFFWGRGASTLPASSVRSRLCSLANSPYLLPT